MADEARSRLGRGLASLIGDVGGEAAHAERPARPPRKVPIEFLKANPRNPRRAFSDDELNELSASIKQHGVIQPIVVRPVKGAQDRYEIIAGERRWRASQRAGLHEVPIVTADVSDSDALEIAIIENVQRSDLNAMEEAQGYHALAADFKRSQDDIAKIVGKSRSHVANMMRLTKLPDSVQAYILEGKLSAGHARALINLPDPAAAAKRAVEEGLSVRQTEALAHAEAFLNRALINLPDPAAAAKRAVEEGLSVRQTEALAHEEGLPQRAPQKARVGSAPKDADTVALEKRISDILGLKVSVDHRNPGGTVQIKYSDLEQLDDILRRLESGR